MRQTFLLLGILGLTFGLLHAFSGSTALLAWRDAYADAVIYTALGLMLSGGFAGTASGMPVPALEGVALAATIRFVPWLCAGLPAAAQELILALLLVWVAGFSVMIARFFATKNQWIYWPEPSVLFLARRKEEWEL